MDNLENQAMEKSIQPQTKECSICFSQRCRKGKDCYPDINAEILSKYTEEENLKMVVSSAAIEGKHYRQATRLEEICLFAKEMDYTRIGIATCIGLTDEAQMIASYLKKYFNEVYLISCKNGGILKGKLDLQQIKEGADEVMCNPIGQALFLNKRKTDMNIICGLCVGHDMLFTRYSEAPVTTIITKDRVLSNNPAAVLYSSYCRKGVLGLER